MDSVDFFFKITILVFLDMAECVLFFERATGLNQCEDDGMGKECAVVGTFFRFLSFSL